MAGLEPVEAILASTEGSPIVKKMHAIREFQSLTRAGLAEAKDAVEGFLATGSWPTGTHVDQPGKVGLGWVEELVHRDRRAQASRALRALTGGQGTPLPRRVGLRESADAVNAYAATGEWPPPVLAAMAPEAIDPARAPSRATEPQESLTQAVARHFSEPEVRLTVRARRRGQEGRFVLLGDRACFLRLGLGRWLLEEDYEYTYFVDPRIDAESPSILRFQHGVLQERVELRPEDAASALAILRATLPPS